MLKCVHVRHGESERGLARLWRECRRVCPWETQDLRQEIDLTRSRCSMAVFCFMRLVLSVCLSSPDTSYSDEAVLVSSWMDTGMCRVEPMQWLINKNAGSLCNKRLVRDLNTWYILWSNPDSPWLLACRYGFEDTVNVVLDWRGRFSIFYNLSSILSYIEICS